MIKFKISLKKLFFLLVLSVSLIVMLIQLFCIGIMVDMSEEQKQNALSSMVAQSSIEIEKKLNTVFSLQNFISTNSNSINLLTKPASIHNDSRREFLTDLMFANRFFNDKITVILANTSGEFDIFLNKLSNDEHTIVQEFYNKHRESGVSDIIFFTIETNTYQELYICAVQPLLYDTTDIVGSKNIGSSIIINRINIYQLLRDMEYADNASLVFENLDDSQTIQFMNGIDKTNALSSSPVKIHNTSYTISGSMIYKHQTSSIFNIIIILVVELIVVILLFLFMNLLLFNKFITFPVKSIVKFMDNFILRNSKERLPDSSITEFSLLSHHINTMLDNNETVLEKIVTTQQKLYESKLSEKDAIFYSLQNQINPHFLYNTLECISGLAISYNADEIVSVTESLSGILRYALNYNSETTVDDEIRMLAEYSNILKARFSNKIEMNFDFDDDIWNKKILRMILQPLVENSVKHSFKNLQSGTLLIDVNGYISDDTLIFTVFDNGGGILPDKLADINKQLKDCEQNNNHDTSIGIANIHRRIVLRYGNEYGLRVESSYGEFTKVIVTMPGI